MFLKPTKKPTTAELLLIIEEAKNAELCRNIQASQQILRSLWEDISADPDFEYCEPRIRAEMLRICGVFLSLFGSARNKKDYQIRGKDLLTGAIDIFKSENLFDKSSEATVMLAFCYWNCGEVEECEDILHTIEAEFADNQLHPVYLQSCVNRLMTLYYSENYQEGVKIIEQLQIPMEFCQDNRLLAMFHNQAGIIYRPIGKYDKAVFHLNEAIKFAKRAGNWLFVAVNYNNLAFLYKEISNLPKAYQYNLEAIKGFKALNHEGFLPHALDTRASIFLSDNEPDRALGVIEDAIKIFKSGENTRGLTDALWTKCVCLFRLERKSEALSLYTELQQIAATRIGATAVRKYEKAFAEIIYLNKGLPLFDELEQYKKSLVRQALIKFGNNLIDVQKYLKIELHQTLSRILTKQFPELYDELGIKRRSSPTPAPKKSEKTSPAKKTGKKIVNADGTRTDFIKHEDMPQEREITHLVMTGVKFSFDFDFRAKEIQTFYFSKKVMSVFGIDYDSLISVVKTKEIREGLFVLISEEKTFYFGQIEYDRSMGFYFIHREDGGPVIVTKNNVVGMPIGYCRFSDSDKNFIEFSQLNFDL